MLQKFRSLLKNEKGLTLIELLAVVVILGIIAAIAVPSIGALIDNSKKDAHVANAQQMVNSARLAITANVDVVDSEGKVTLAKLISEDFIETIEDPDNGSYDTTDSYVIIENGEVDQVRLVNDTRGIFTETGGVAVSSLNRESVTKLSDEETE
ncbi:type II secretion system protein [Sutcliffiella halmapala]